MDGLVKEWKFQSGTKRVKTYLTLSIFFLLFCILLMNLLFDMIQEIFFFFRQWVWRFHCLKIQINILSDTDT